MIEIRISYDLSQNLKPNIWLLVCRCTCVIERVPKTQALGLIKSLKIALTSTHKIIMYLCMSARVRCVHVCMLVYIRLFIQSCCQVTSIIL